MTGAHSPAARPLVVMGVSGCGKSTLAHALALRCGATFIEGDGLHPAANVAKMASGSPLTDEDRWPYLENVAHAIRAVREGGAVAACSALRRIYRDVLRRTVGSDIMFVMPAVAPQELKRRLRARTDHFMPATLLQSQLDTLEPPQPPETYVVVDGHLPLARQMDAVMAAVRA